MKTFEVDRVSLGFNAAEVYLKFGDVVVILSPSVAKRLLLDLKALQLPLDEPRSHDPKSAPRAESVAHQVLRALYKSHRVNKSLITVNTNRRKKLPDRD